MINLVFIPYDQTGGGDLSPLFFTVRGAKPGLYRGLWLLKRWAALVFGALLICNQIVLLVRYWALSAAIIPAAIILLMFKHLDKMS